MTDHYPRGLVLFDCDGTLSDSHHAIVAAMQDAFRSRGFPVPEEASVTPLIGLSLSVVLQHLLSSMNQAFTTDDLARLSNAYRQHYHRHEKQVALFPGVREGLMTLHQQGWWLGIVTGKSRAGLDRLLAHFSLNDYFLTTHTADECRSKPHPEMVEQALAATGMSTQQCQVIGDSHFDMKMAVNAGVTAIGVSYGHASADRLLAAGASHVADDFDELIHLLLR